MNGLTWTCHVCGCERPDHLIGVLSKDVSADYGLPEGTMTMNVRYCNDSPECARKAATHRFGKKGGL